VVAGLFVPDASRGYPPGAAVTPHEPSRRHRVHHLLGGPVAFLALFGAGVTSAFRLRGVWRLYTALTALFGLVLTIATAAAYQRDARRTGLVQRGLILTYWTWIVAFGIHLTRSRR